MCERILETHIDEIIRSEIVCGLCKVPLDKDILRQLMPESDYNEYIAQLKFRKVDCSTVTIIPNENSFLMQEIQAVHPVKYAAISSVNCISRAIGLKRFKGCEL